MTPARYDAAADFYQAGWPDRYDDPATATLLTLTGDVHGHTVLDIACGHGRITRELARRGATVTGIDLSSALIDAARQRETRDRLGIRYIRHDAATIGPDLDAGRFDVAVCSMGLVVRR